MENGVECQGEEVPLITDRNQICFAKMVGCGLQKEVLKEADKVCVLKRGLINKTPASRF